MEPVKHRILLVISSIVLSSLFFLTAPARAQTDANIDRLFDWAEATYPQYFGSHQTMRKEDIWRYRYYPQHGTYIGVNDKREVHVLGPVFGGLVYVGGFDYFMTLLGGPTATYTVGGPNAKYATLQALFAAEDLKPGDIVDVTGGIVYPGGIVMPKEDGGAPGNPVILRGVGQTRPHLRGGTNTIEFGLSNHVVMEHFEISGTETPVNTFRCVFHHAHDITLRDLYVHDCPRHGILGADQDSGSLTIEYSEISNGGSGGTRHLIYMATDEVAYPGAVFRLQYSYVHDSDYTNGTGLGGNLIKSRAERNEIYYNWLEGGYYHELELISPDPDGARSSWTENLAREDSDIVGNMIVHTNTTSAILRFGSDLDYNGSNGRYRFVNNTVVGIGTTTTTPTVFRLFGRIESLDAHNNVIWREGSSGVRVIREVEATWTGGATRINGSNNWIDTGSTFIPAGFAGTTIGADPGFANVAAADFRPNTDSPLVDRANSLPLAPPGYEIAAPIFPASRFPPRPALILPGTPFPPPASAVLDIGAYQLNDSN